MRDNKSFRTAVCIRKPPDGVWVIQLMYQCILNCTPLFVGTKL